jgi:hypothetical protein
VSATDLTNKNPSLQRVNSSYKLDTSRGSAYISDIDIPAAEQRRRLLGDQDEFRVPSAKALEKKTEKALLVTQLSHLHESEYDTNEIAIADNQDLSARESEDEDSADTSMKEKILFKRVNLKASTRLSQITVELCRNALAKSTSGSSRACIKESLPSTWTKSNDVGALTVGYQAILSPQAIRLKMLEQELPLSLRQHIIKEREVLVYMNKKGKGARNIRTNDFNLGELGWSEYLSRGW